MGIRLKPPSPRLQKGPKPEGLAYPEATAKIQQQRQRHYGLVEVGAAQEVAAGAADEFAAAVFEAGAAGGAEAGVMFCGEWA